MNLTFIGGGNMASALIGGLLRKGWAPEALRVVDPDPAARERLRRNYRLQADAGMTAESAQADCIVLAVKPQQLQQVARTLRALLGDALVITIAAGIRLADLTRWLGGHRRLVRAMPNTPALALAGMTGLYAPDDVAPADRAHAEQILGVAGATLWVEREEQMDAITAISGSGPAYVYYYMEALEQAGRALGFDAEAARCLVLQTFKGAVELAAESTDELATLRARVTSRGGTTERALLELEKDRVREAIVRAVHAAAERSRELGEALGRDEPAGKGSN
jgi:pyrroline-5-carboxylate reductase